MQQLQARNDGPISVGPFEGQNQSNLEHPKKAK
jgi:hypothetical protein